MQFFKGLLINLGLLLVIGLVLFVLFPDPMRQIFQTYCVIFGPIVVILLIVVAALPRKR
jgi:hypothetical protein